MGLGGQHVYRSPVTATQFSNWPTVSSRWEEDHSRRTQEALTALNSYGISGHDLEDDRLHVTGWDVRLLHCGWAFSSPV